MNARLLGVIGIGLVAALAVIAQELPDRPVAGWPAPPYWLPAGVMPAASSEAAESQEETAEPVVVRALPLVAIPPCRLLDMEAEGRPALLRGESLEIAVLERCRVPATARALSVRLEAVESTADGALALRVAGKEGDHNGRVTLDSAKVGSVTGVVPLDESGRLVIFSAAASSEVVLDVNGYYAAEPAVRSLNALAGDVTLRAGESIAITSEGNTVTIAVKANEGSGVDRPDDQARPQVRSVVQVQPSQSVKRLPPVRAMAPPSSSMYVGGAFGLPDTTALGAGVLTLGGDRFLHNYGPVTDAWNTFLGENAGNFTMGGADVWEGTNNTGVGFASLAGNTTGYHNTAIGARSLASNTAGYGNTAVGPFSLTANVTGDSNTATGVSSLASNTAGRANIAYGDYSLYMNTTGQFNTAIGFQSLYFSTTASENVALGSGSLRSNTTAERNTALGTQALSTQSFSNSDTIWNSDNTAVGFEALYSNEPTSTSNGTYNTAVGSLALRSNTTGFGNTAIGVQGLATNITGYANTASGYESLYSNTTGHTNTATGRYSLYLNTEGSDNTASGYQSLYSNATGHYNAAIGTNAGASNHTGSYNTFLGASSNASANDLNNATAIGANAVVDASNHVRIGNTAVTQIGGEVAWSNLSDARHKENIRDLDLGLDFVLGLRPVAFRMKRGNGRTDMGFLAQDIESLLGDGYNVLGIGQDAERTLSLRATDLIAPLVKAIQDQQELIEAQQARLERLEREVEALRSANAGR